MLYIEHTNEFFCFPLSKSLISMLYIEHTNEKIEHTNEYIEHTYELQAGGWSSPGTACHRLS